MSKKSDLEFFTLMKERFHSAEEAEREIRSEALLDWRFRAGTEENNGQWDDKIFKQRDDDHRPCYTINRIQQFVRHITNEQRQQLPAIEMSPIGDGADVETAEIEQGLARHVEQNTDGDIAYDTAFDCMVTGGFGWFRILADYSSPMSMDQDARYERVLNPFSVYHDPGAKKPDYSDGRWLFVVEDILVPDYKELYPHSELAGLNDFSSIGDRAPAGWLTSASIRVVEYFYVESEKKTLVRCTDGTDQLKDKLKKGAKVAVDPKTGEAKERETSIDTVYWCKTNGLEYLEEEVEVPASSIPVIPVLGEEFVADGKRYLVGIVRYARAPQQMYNLWSSAMAETIALAPKAPYLATPAQIAGHEKIWDTANTTAWPWMPYNPDPKAAGAPQRQFAEPATQAIIGAIAHADNDLKATTGLYDDSLGEKGPAEAGKAILLRKKQGDTANFGFSDNMARSVKQGARVLQSMFRKIYDTARIVRIIKPDGTKDQVAINQKTMRDGVERVFDLTSGNYDVSVNVGPSLPSRRAEAASSMLQLVSAYPALMQYVGDLLVSNMDWPGATEIAARLKKLLPAVLQDPAAGQEPVPAAAQAQLAKQNAMIAQMTQALHAMSQKMEAKTAELASRERIALMNNRAGIAEALITAKSAEAKMVFQADLDQIDRQLALIPDPALAAPDAPDGSAAAPGASATSGAPAPSSPQPLAA